MDGTADASAEVLVVEDEVAMAALFTRWLADDHDVRVAHDCRTAHEELDDAVDVVLLDRRLPDGSGTEVLEHVRDADYECRVAVVTAVEPDFDIVEMGFDDYLTKPTDRAEVRSVVDRLIAHSRYRESVTELYALVKKRALIEANKPRSKIESSEEFAELTARIEALEDEVSGLAETFSERQFSAELARIDAGE